MNVDDRFTSPEPRTKLGSATTTSFPAAAAARAISSPARFEAGYGSERACGGNTLVSSAGRSRDSAGPSAATLDT